MRADAALSPLPLCDSRCRPCRVIAEHESKIASDPLHAMVEADMRDAQARARKGGLRAPATFDPERLRQQGGRRLTPSQLATVGLLAIFDANTVEAVLLASAILLCLSGIMFASDRFSQLLIQYYQAVRGTFGAVERSDHPALSHSFHRSTCL